MKFVNGKAAEIWSETWKFLRDRLKLQQKLENFEITDFWIVATGFLYLKTDLSWIDISCYAECHIYILRVARPRVWYIISIHGRKCAYLGLRNVRFTEHLACFVFLLPPFWDFLFCLNTDDIKTFELIKLRFFRTSLPIHSTFMFNFNKIGNNNCNKAEYQTFYNLSTKRFMLKERLSLVLNECHIHFRFK